MTKCRPNDHARPTPLISDPHCRGAGPDFYSAANPPDPMAMVKNQKLPAAAATRAGGGPAGGREAGHRALDPSDGKAWGRDGPETVRLR